MKKIAFLLIAALVCGTAFSQIKVLSNGNTGIGSSTPVTKFQVIGNSTFSATTSSITSSALIRGLNGYSTATNPDYTWYNNDQTGLFHPSSNEIGFAIGGAEKMKINAKGVGIGVTPSYGEFQIGGSWTFQRESQIGHQIGRNTYYDWSVGQNKRIAYGVASRISFGTNGNIILQTAKTQYDNAGTIVSSWHALILDWNGNVGIGTDGPSYKLDVNGIVRANNVNVSSDERLKRNIKAIEIEERNKIYLLNGKSYFKKLEIPQKGDSLNIAQEVYDGEKLDTEIAEYGFLAQELEKLYPELVFKDNAGYYSVNYTALIPIIVEALKEQNNTIETMQQESRQEREFLRQEIENLTDALNACCNKITPKSSEFDNSNTQNGNTETLKVYQNAPNPFNTSTTIQCYIPKNMQNVQLCIYDMTGTLLKCIVIPERGNASIEIQAGQLAAGIYTYLLIGDGKASEAKQMILTK